jgi:hypothetical protein
MRFMMLVIPKDYALPDPGMVETMEKYNAALREAGALISLDGLRPPASGARIRFRHGKAEVTRGPFPGAGETLGGFWMIRAKSLDEAVEWASRAPMADGDVIEVRQVQETEDFPAEVRKVIAAAARPSPRRNETRA